MLVAKFDEMINLSMNYRYDPDICSYLSVVKREHPPTGRYLPRIPLSNKTRSVAWAVSHCKADSRMDENFAELTIYIYIYIYIYTCIHVYIGNAEFCNAHKTYSTKVPICGNKNTSFIWCSETHSVKMMGR